MLQKIVRRKAYIAKAPLGCHDSTILVKAKSIFCTLPFPPSPALETLHLIDGTQMSQIGLSTPNQNQTIPDEQKQLQHRAYKRSQSHINPLTTGMQPANNFADQKQVDNDVLLHICICLLTTVIAFLLVCLSKRQIKEEWTIQIEQKLARLRSVFENSCIMYDNNLIVTFELF